MRTLEIILWGNLIWWAVLCIYWFGQSVGEEKGYWKGRRAGYELGWNDRKRNSVTR